MCAATALATRQVMFPWLTCSSKGKQGEAYLQLPVTAFMRKEAPHEEV